MKFNRKILSEIQPIKTYISKQRLREDEIDFKKLRSYRLDRVRNELKKNNIEYLKLINEYPYKYQKLNLNDENFNGVTFYFNERIDYNYDVKNGIFEINQNDLSGRSFFFDGQINDCLL